MLRVLQFTDTHLYADEDEILHGENPDKNLQRVIEHSLQYSSPADFALLTGDLVHDEPDAYQRLKLYLQRLKIPVYCLPGNHDDPQIMKQVFTGHNIQVPRSVFHDNWQIILLDSTVSGLVGGRLGQGELDWVETCLKHYPEHYALICLHHPPFATGSQWLDKGLGLENPEDLFAVLDQFSQVRCVLWGHVHQEFFTQRKRVLYLATPSTAIQFKKNSVDFAVDVLSPAYRWLALHGDGSIDTGVQYI